MLHMHKFTFQPSGSGFPAHAGKGLSTRAPGNNAAKTPGKGLSSGRQALGNITNTAGALLVHLNVSTDCAWQAPCHMKTCSYNIVC